MDRMDRIRLWLCRLLCPPTHRLIEVGDVVTDPRDIRSDLVNGANALERGWDCAPEILWNAAAHLQMTYYARHYMGQIMAECDCSRGEACEEAGRCLALEERTT